MIISLFISVLSPKQQQRKSRESVKVSEQPSYHHRIIYQRRRRIPSENSHLGNTVRPLT